MDKTYNNYTEFLNDNESLALELLEHVGAGEWQKEEIHYYVNKENFARYELTEGWYIDSNFEKDYNGAPNPIEYINFDSFGDALISSWDSSCNYNASSGEILTTSCGW